MNQLLFIAAFLFVVCIAGYCYYESNIKTCFECPKECDELNPMCQGCKHFKGGK